MQHLMVDIETGNNKPNSGILSIGAVKFDPVAGKIGDEFYRAIDPVDAFANGSVGGDTFRWWMRQSDAAREAAVCGTTKLADALTELVKLYPDWRNVKVWGNSPSFDMVILEHAFRRVLNREAPWAFWNTRDCRTVAELAGQRPPKIATSAGVHHNALDDAKHQARWVMSMWNGLKGKSAAPAPAAPVEQPKSGGMLDL